MEIPLTPAALLRSVEGPAAALAALPRVLADLAASVEALSKAGRHADDVAEDAAALVSQARTAVEDSSGTVQRVVASLSAFADALPPEQARAVAERLEPTVDRADALLASLEGPVGRLRPVLEGVADRLDDEAVARLAGLVTQERVDRLLVWVERTPDDLQRVDALLELAEQLLPRMPAAMDTVEQVLPRLEPLLDVVQGRLLVEDGVLNLPEKLDAMARDTASLRADVTHLRGQLDERMPDLEGMSEIIEGLPGAGIAKRRGASNS